MSNINKSFRIAIVEMENEQEILDPRPNGDAAMVLYVPKDGSTVDGESFEATSLVQTVNKPYRQRPLDIERIMFKQDGNCVAGEAPIICPRCGNDLRGERIDVRDHTVEHVCGVTLTMKYLSSIGAKAILAQESVPSRLRPLTPQEVIGLRPGNAPERGGK